MTNEEINELKSQGLTNLILDKNLKRDYNEDFQSPCYVFDLEEVKAYKIDPWVIKR